VGVETEKAKICMDYKTVDIGQQDDGISTQTDFMRIVAR
jgi:hypothetical protein